MLPISQSYIYIFLCLFVFFCFDNNYNILLFRAILIVDRVREMLEQMSHPSVQKYIHGSIVTGGGRRGGGSNDSDKNKDGKTYEQIKRDKRQILIRCVVFLSNLLF